MKSVIPKTKHGQLMSKKFFSFITITICCMILQSCAFRTKKHTYYKPPSKVYTGYSETGIASWYGSDFHGKPTASGEIYNMYAMTAAHKTLPLGTYVKVTNLENGRSVIVKINDRGPFVKGRIIDLTYTAAKKLGMIHKGTARVRLNIVGTHLKFRNNNFHFKKFYAVQLASFKLYDNAVGFKKYVKKYFVKAYVKKLSVKGNTFYRVLIGNYKKRKYAENVLKLAEKRGFDGFIVEIDK